MAKTVSDCGGLKLKGFLTKEQFSREAAKAKKQATKPAAGKKK